MMSQTARTNPIDELMERASRALTATDYFEAEKLCMRAAERCVRSGDFERLARVCMPLQEARRQRCQIATDAGFRSVLKAFPRAGEHFENGCYLIEPPLVGVDAGIIREAGRRQKVSMLVLVREPMTAAGKWPIVGVGSGPWLPVVRIQVDPPASGMPDAKWFMETQEKLGDAAITKVSKDWPADHRVEDVLEYLDAVPEHEKLHQALEAACREALLMPERTKTPRRRGKDDPSSF